MPSFQSYILCTSPRSGSTLLCRLLAATGVAGRPASLFHEPSLDDWRERFGLSGEKERGERDMLAQIFTSALERGRGGTGLFGLRLQRHSFAFFSEKLAVLHPDRPDDAARLEAAFGPTLFIHLTRLDKIGQAVSYVKAQQSGLWHRASDGTELERLSPPREPVYDAALLRSTHDTMVTATGIGKPGSRAMASPRCASPMRRFRPIREGRCAMFLKRSVSIRQQRTPSRRTSPSSPTQRAGSGRSGCARISGSRDGTAPAADAAVLNLRWQVEGFPRKSGGCKIRQESPCP